MVRRRGAAARTVEARQRLLRRRVVRCIVAGWLRLVVV